MTKKLAIGAFAMSTIGVAVVYGAAFLPGGAPAIMVPVMILCIATMMVAMMVIGSERGGRIGRLAGPFALAWLIIVGGFLAVYLLPADTVANPSLFFGLPRRAAIVLYGIGLVPLLAMPFAYALTFDDITLSEDDLARLRREADAILARERSEVAR